MIYTGKTARKSDSDRMSMLGMPYIMATQIILSKVLFYLAQQTNRDICYFCGEKIRSLRGDDMFVVTHGRPNYNENVVEHFFDLNNVRPAHFSCCSHGIRSWRLYAGVHPIAGMIFSGDDITDMGFDLPYNQPKLKKDNTKRFDVCDEYILNDPKLIYGGGSNVSKMGVFASLLKKKIIVEWANECGYSKCYKCGDDVLDLIGRRALAIGHKERYTGRRDGYTKFFAMDNLCLKHKCCSGVKGNKDLDEKEDSKKKKVRERYIERDLIKLSVYNPSKTYKNIPPRAVFDFGDNDFSVANSLNLVVAPSGRGSNSSTLIVMNEMEKEDIESNVCGLRDSVLFGRAIRTNEFNKSGKRSGRSGTSGSCKNGHSRSPYIREGVIRIAEGCCQLHSFGNICRTRDGLIEFYQDGDFVRTAVGHHIKYLSSGGLDIFENVIAVCRTCHAIIHSMEEDWYYDEMIEIARINAEKIMSKHF